MRTARCFEFHSLLALLESIKICNCICKRQVKPESAWHWTTPALFSVSQVILSDLHCITSFSLRWIGIDFRDESLWSSITSAIYFSTLVISARFWKVLHAFSLNDDIRNGARKYEYIVQSSDVKGNSFISAISSSWVRVLEVLIRFPPLIGPSSCWFIKSNAPAITIESQSTLHCATKSSPDSCQRRMKTLKCSESFSFASGVRACEEN